MAAYTSLDLLLPENSVVAICPLNWGLGHASRCIPLIQKAIHKNNKVIIASDGEALEFLKSEFPHLKFYELAPYDIQYPYQSIFLNLLKNTFRIWSAILGEKRQINDIILKENIAFLISDNRFGVQTVHCPSAFICHQMHIYHKNYMLRMAMNLVNKAMLLWPKNIWIPDYEGSPNLAGDLSHKMPSWLQKKSTFIGPLSTVNHEKDTHQRENILIILSGPEPQRSLLEEKLMVICSEIPFKSPIVLIRGTKSACNQSFSQFEKVFDFATRAEVQNEINKAKAIICRSGYSTIMDLSDYEGRVLYIPTPGQTEQEYLAENHSTSPKINTVSQVLLSRAHLMAFMDLTQ